MYAVTEGWVGYDEWDWRPSEDKRMLGVKRIITSLLVVLLGALLVGTTRVQAVVLDMEGVAPNGSISFENDNDRAMGDFNLHIPHGHFRDSASPHTGNNSGTRQFVGNGTDYLMLDTDEPLTLTRLDRGSFAIQSFDSTFYFLNFNGDPNRNHVINVAGTRSGGGDLNASFTIDDLDPFQTFTFDSVWADLTAVAFSFGDNNEIADGNQAFDNIVVIADSEAGPGPAIDPKAVIALLNDILFGDSLTLDGLGSFDTDGTVDQYEWDLDYDGSTFRADFTGGPAFSLTSTDYALWSAGGLFNVGLRVTDNDGGTDIASTTIQVNLPALIPEPTTLALFGLGLFGLGIARRRRISRRWE